MYLAAVILLSMPLFYSLKNLPEGHMHDCGLSFFSGVVRLSCRCVSAGEARCRTPVLPFLDFLPPVWLNPEGVG
jgi:hypothetical protein